MPIFQEIANSDFTSGTDGLDMIIDFIESDISSSSSRRKYQHYVTSALSSSGVTSSLYQTVYDQDFTLPTANATFDITFGLALSSSLVTSSLIYTDSTTGQLYFPSQSLMMREKIDRYRQMAQKLLGDADAEFSVVSGASTIKIREPLFITFKRLFHRDRFKRETFAIKLLTASNYISGSASGEKIYSDVGSSTNQEFSFGGAYSTVVDSSNTSYPIGLLYLDSGIVVLDTQRIFDVTQSIAGTIRSVAAGGINSFSGTLNQLMVSASVDDFIDHIASTRFGSSSYTAIAFQNQTLLNTSYITVQLPYSNFNYSSNPSYVDSNGRIVVIEQGQEDVQKSFVMFTSVGFYDANNNLLAIGKTNRPIYKDANRSLQLTTRIDY
ncbi:MAG TPA: hypothetical protein PLP33_10455 [Leptospiraceae bacterium]|nr:hypothetical protein [Leptospiraceae bacterium]